MLRKRILQLSSAATSPYNINYLVLAGGGGGGARRGSGGGAGGLKSSFGSSGGGASVWGFINKANPKFKEGDVLLAAGWGTPALNKSRGNLIDGYPVLKMGDRFMYGPGYCSGAIAGTPRDGGFV